jgi:hypothetical protein
MIANHVNKHGLPILIGSRTTQRRPVIPTPHMLDCHTQERRGLAMHTLDGHRYCDACYEQALEHMIWATYR